MYIRIECSRHTYIKKVMASLHFYCSLLLLLACSARTQFQYKLKNDWIDVDILSFEKLPRTYRVDCSQPLKDGMPRCSCGSDRYNNHILPKAFYRSCKEWLDNELAVDSSVVTVENTMSCKGNCFTSYIKAQIHCSQSHGSNLDCSVVFSSERPSFFLILYVSLLFPPLFAVIMYLIVPRTFPFYKMCDRIVASRLFYVIIPLLLASTAIGVVSCINHSYEDCILESEYSIKKLIDPFMVVVYSPLLFTVIYAMLLKYYKHVTVKSVHNK